LKQKLAFALRRTTSGGVGFIVWLDVSPRQTGDYDEE
jgi:hypothetical protein